MICVLKELDMIKIYTCRQHFIDFSKFDLADFFEKYQNADTYTQREYIASIPVQTNPEWKELRAGRFTCSTADAFLSNPVKKEDKEAGKIGKSANKLCYRVIAEKTSNWRESDKIWQNRDSVARGLVFEPIARMLAEKRLGKKIHEVGFIARDEYFGWSPDGISLLDENKGLEIENADYGVEFKAPEPPAFYEMLDTMATEDYEKEMQMAMWGSGLKKIYFVLYCPEIDPQEVYILSYTRGIKYQAAFNERAPKMIANLHRLESLQKNKVFNIPTAK